MVSEQIITYRENTQLNGSTCSSFINLFLIYSKARIKRDGVKESSKGDVRMDLDSNGWMDAEAWLTLLSPVWLITQCSVREQARLADYIHTAPLASHPHTHT
ncbi:hypothetical protein GOODEAATRI_003520 [Goodea atripinnis]|uniref:Uncharacterized protein n=1 Tax=Goodea atripinnis TaxID=208336 RepID=A0ABV0P175_9TELE